MDQWQRLQLHPFTHRVAFDPAKRCFVLDGSKLRGLTRALDRLLPAVEQTTCSPAAAEISDKKRSRTYIPLDQAGNVHQFLAQQALLRASLVSTLSSDKLQSTTLGHVGDAPFVMQVHRLASSANKPCAHGRSDRAHGLRVDKQMSALVQQGKVTGVQASLDKRSDHSLTAGRRDSCVNGLLLHLRHSLGWEPLASQVPLFLQTLQLGTAIDLICTDVATRTRFILVELKATLHRAACTKCSSPLASCTYAATTTPNVTTLPVVAVAGETSTVVMHLANTAYTRHQLQLWAMKFTLEHDYGIRVDEAHVLRIGAGGKLLITYALDPKCTQFRQHLVNWLNKNANWTETNGMTIHSNIVRRSLPVVSSSSNRRGPLAVARTARRRSRAKSAAPPRKRAKTNESASS